MDYLLGRLYRLPYTREDSPSVIIEPTTDCNLRCPGCYRKSGFENKDYMAFGEVKDYIATVLKLRNVSQLLASGGEPLLYPELDGPIQYARSKGLQVKINTNGVLLDRARLEELKRLGVEGIQIHLDKHQRRGRSEEEVIEFRERYCRLFREVGDIRLGFHNIIRRKDWRDLKRMAGFFQSNADIVSEINFSAFCPAPKRIGLVARLPVTKMVVGRIKAGYKTTVEKVREAFGFEYGSYLPSKYEEDRPGKLYALSFYRDGKLLGSATKEQFRQAHQRYYDEHGCYGYGTEMFETVLAVAGLDPEEVAVQFVRVSLPPVLIGTALSICDSCVDPVLYQNRLVPMCVLEYVRRGEKVAIEIER